MIRRVTKSPGKGNAKTDDDANDDEAHKHKADLDARFRSVSEKLRLGVPDAGSLSRIETTRVNLDGVKVFVPKVSGIQILS